MKKQVNALRARTKDEINAIADRLRRDLCVEDVCAINVVSLTEFGLSRLIPDFTFSIVKDDAFESNILALARDNPPEIVVRESVYCRAAKQEPMARWVLAHEIGHIILQHAKPADSGHHSNQFDVTSAECQANMFAQSLLLPSDLIASCNSPSEISVKFLVSHSAAEARFREVRQKTHERIAVKAGRDPDGKASCYEF
jgi:Zn-dependent peptidase ImmA (M78 family)